MNALPPNGESEPAGTAANRVRTLIRQLPPSASAADLVALLGEPDHIAPYSDPLPAPARQQLESGLFGDIAASVVKRDPVDANSTWVYVNPYINSINHCFAIADGKVVRQWETRSRKP